MRRLIIDAGATTSDCCLMEGGTLRRFRAPGMNVASMQEETVTAAVQAVLQREVTRYQQQTSALNAGIRAVYEREKHRFELNAARLHGLSPTAKLVKGFGYISLAGVPLTSTAQAKPGDLITVRIHDGELEAGVTQVRRETNE